MKEHPILFSGPMVRAILEGRKTQTRRVVKMVAADDGNLVPEIGVGYSRCPYGKTGDRLWVRETHSFVADQFAITPGVAYKADGAIRWLKSIPDGTIVHNENDPRGWKWRPSVFMPRWASRITLYIVDVRVERVRDIGADDAKAEGVKFPMLNGWMDSAKWRGEFSMLWDSINDSRGFGWDVNPWVWVIEFQRAG